MVAKYFRSRFEQIRKGCGTSAELHAIYLESSEGNFMHLRSNNTCLYCLFRNPQAVIGTEHEFTISACLLCRSWGSVTARLKPPTAGVRILSIDGGGTRGVVPLEYLRLVQEEVGNTIPVPDLIDFAIGGLIALILFLYRWDVDRCCEEFDRLVRKFFTKVGRKRQSLLVKFRDYLRCWLSDGCYDATTLETCLKETFGDSQRMFDSFKFTSSGAKVAVTATSISDASSFLFTNYNPSGTRNRDCGYKHVRPDNLEDEPFVWEAARATSAAPIPAHIPAHGAFQDGGLKHNNPINLALTEMRAIWPTSPCPDVVLSLGTGMTETQSPVAPHFRHVLNDGFIPRLYRSFMSSFDGESVWRDLQNRLDERAKRDYFRFNLEMKDTPLIDDTSRMTEFRQSVSAQPATREHCHDVTIALLVSCFFFELEAVPCFDKGAYRCEGTVRCRTLSENVPRVLSGRYTRIEFITDGGVLGTFDSYHDICWACHRYSKKLLFYVQHPSDVISLELRLGDHQRRRLSGFPQSMEWFVKQQGLDADFGTPDHGSPGTLYCRVCEPARSLLRKRKNGNPNLAQNKKAKTAGNSGQ
ncbi:MAG: hypothetical protein Q9157_003189 [Trypethelium eluteriae]